MFRSFSGFKSQYYYLNLVIASEFDGWKVLIYSPGVTIHGARQLSESSAKDHAVAIAKSYIHEEKHEDVPVLPAVDWAPSSREDWLVWR